MNRVCLLAAVSALALATLTDVAAAGPAANSSRNFRPSPKGAKLLYDQNSNSSGNGVGSQNFTSGTFSSSDNSGADDFVVPKKMRWTITEVDVTGFYYNGPGPAKSEDVIFYRDDNGVPGKRIARGLFRSLVGADENGSFAITLPGHGLSLKPGTYWVAVIANCSYKGGCGEWAWELSTVDHGNKPMWREPGKSRCGVWTEIESCFGYDGDLEFALGGKEKRK